MSAALTQGRLVAHALYADSEIRDEQDTLIAVVPRYRHDIARRLVSCWNSCDGIQTELLEQIPGIAGATVPYRVLRAEHATLQTDRDLLLLERDMLRDALQGMVDSYEHEGSANNPSLLRALEVLGEVTVPRVVLPAEAVAAGAALDSESLEQGEPA
jgi:hypothetical protein